MSIFNYINRLAWWEWARIAVISIFASCFYYMSLLFFSLILEKTHINFDFVQSIILVFGSSAFVTIWGLDNLDWSWLK